MLAGNILVGAPSLEAGSAPQHPAKQTASGGRLGLALALTPLVPAFYGTSLFAQPWDMAVLLPYAYLAELLIGLPMALWLGRRGWRHPLWYGSGGLLCSLPLLLAYVQIGTPPHFEPFGPTAALIVAAGGFLSGLSFWLLGVSGDAPVRWRDLIDPMP